MEVAVVVDFDLLLVLGAMEEGCFDWLIDGGWH